MKDKNIWEIIYLMESALLLAYRLEYYMLQAFKKNGEPNFEQSETIK
jgi:hypothetical protein